MTITIYWVSTLLLITFLLISSYTYFFSKTTIAGLSELGFPDFFRKQLGVLKLLAVVALLFECIPLYIKEWAYAGVGFFLLTAVVAHIAHKDGTGIFLMLFVLILCLIASRYTLPF